MIEKLLRLGALEGRVELFFLDGSYIGLELIETASPIFASCLPRATVARLGSGWPALSMKSALAPSRDPGIQAASAQGA